MGLCKGFQYISCKYLVANTHRMDLVQGLVKLVVAYPERFKEEQVKQKRRGSRCLTYNNETE